MAELQWEYTQIRIAEGNVSLPGQGYREGELELLDRDMRNEYYIYARSGQEVSWVCELSFF